MTEEMVPVPRRISRFVGWLLVVYGVVSLLASLVFLQGVVEMMDQMTGVQRWLLGTVLSAISVLFPLAFLYVGARLLGMKRLFRDRSNMRVQQNAEDLD